MYLLPQHAKYRRTDGRTLLTIYSVQVVAVLPSAVDMRIYMAALGGVDMMFDVSLHGETEVDSHAYMYVRCRCR